MLQKIRMKAAWSDTTFTLPRNNIRLKKCERKADTFLTFATLYTTLHYTLQYAQLHTIF